MIASRSGDPRLDNRDRDSGEVVAQLVIITPVLLLLILLGVQAAIYFHAANVAGAAASQGAAAASPRSAGAADGVEAALQTISDLGSATARPAAVEEANGYVSVTVTIAVARLVPFFPDAVSRSAVEPKERFVPESDR